MFVTGNPVKIVNIHPIERFASVIGGSLLAGAGIRRGSRRGGMMMLAASEMLRRGLTGRSFLYQVLGMRTKSTGQGAKTTSVPYELGERARAAIRIERPRPEVFAFWRELTNLPRFMKHVKSVKMIDSKRSHWTAQAPAGRCLEWDAEVIREIPNELISWRSIDGSAVDSAGSVKFKDTPSGGTAVSVEFQYNPPAGAAGTFVAKLFGRDPQAEMQTDLMRLKYHLEHAEVPQSRI
jgi:uncharacterized membrane protein